MCDVEKAITIKTWLIWYAQQPEQEAVHESTCGDSEWHRRCIEGYDHVIRVLEAIK